MAIVEFIDYYKVLKIAASASEDEIKKSYYKLAKEWHPDKNSSSDAETKFKEINQAYQVLSDTSKRQAFDLQRIEKISKSTVTTKNTNTTSTSTSTKYERANAYSPYNTSFYYEQFKNDQKDNKKETTNKPKNRPFNSRGGVSSSFKEFFETNSHLFDYDDDDNDDDDLDNAYGDLEDEYLFELLKQTKRASKPKWNNNWASEPPTTSSQRTGDIFEDYSMYRMFKDISTRLYNDVTANDRLLLNLTLIIGQLNNLMGKDEELKHKSQQQKSPYSSNHQSRQTAFNRMPQKTTKRDNWEFDWLGSAGVGGGGKSSTNSNQRDVDDDGDYDDIDEFEDLLLNCRYCNRQLSDEDSLIKHENICKKLSHNSTNKNSQNKITKCPVCKIDLNSYEYLMHNCSTTSTNNDTYKSKKKSSPYTGIKREKMKNDVPLR